MAAAEAPTSLKVHHTANIVLRPVHYLAGRFILFESPLISQFRKLKIEKLEDIEEINEEIHWVSFISNI